MTDPTNFTVSFRVPQNPLAVFDAINRARDWWVGEFTGSSDTVGATFTYAYPPYHHTVQEVTELVPGKRVAWKVIESAIHFVEDGSEWKDTTIRFDLAENGGGTEVTFTHQGLTPKLACYQNCSAGWEFYILESLQTFIHTGAGVKPPF